MALSRVCACARSARVVVLVLLASTLVELCLPQTLPPVTENYSHVTFLKVVDAASDVEPSPSPVRSTESAENNGGGSEPEDRRKLGYSFESDAAPWRESTEAMSGDEDGHRIRMMMLARRGRSLRTSKPYPCSLPAGTTCKQTESCCGSVCAIVATNPNHCGRCGHICRSDRACCGGKCRRLATDERNCGRCGSRCAVGTKCLFGLCGY
jgi:hypothetical protein